MVAQAIHAVKQQAPREISAYWEFYGLQYDPFPLATQINNVYICPRWEKIFDLLHHQIFTHNFLFAITGMQGSGKTVFIEELSAQFAENGFYSQVNATAEFDFAKLKSIFNEEFCLPLSDDDGFEEQLDFYLEKIQKEGKHYFLLIDDAHCLPDKTLRALLYLIAQQPEAQIRLHIIIAGMALLKNRLAQLAQHEGYPELLHFIDLGQFSVEEMQSYLVHCLHAAKLPAAVPFTMEVYERIHKLSKGLPKQIQYFARRELMAAIKQHSLIKTADFYQNYKNKILGGSVFLVVLIFLAFVFARGSYYPNQRAVPERSAITEQEIIISPPHVPIKKVNLMVAQNDVLKVKTNAIAVVKHVNPMLMADKAPVRDEAILAKNQSAIKPLPSALNFPVSKNLVSQSIKPMPKLTSSNNVVNNAVLSSSNSAVIKNTQPVMSTQTLGKSISQNPINVNNQKNTAAKRVEQKIIAVDQQTKVLPAAKNPAVSIRKEVFTASVSQQKINLIAQPNKTIPVVKNSVVTIQQQVIPVPLVEEKNNWVKQPVQTIAVIKNPLGQVTAIKEPTNVAMNPVKINSPIQQSIGFSQNNKVKIHMVYNPSKPKLLTANPQHYTLQLIGLSSEGAMKSFIARNHLGSAAVYFHSQLKGKDWYVLLYGEYPTSVAAKTALQTLPAAVQAEHPWVRTMANVQLSLKRAENSPL